MNIVNLALPEARGKAHRARSQQWASVFSCRSRTSLPEAWSATSCLQALKAWLVTPRRLEASMVRPKQSACQQRCAWMSSQVNSLSNSLSLLKVSLMHLLHLHLQLIYLTRTQFYYRSGPGEASPDPRSRLVACSLSWSRSVSSFISLACWPSKGHETLTAPLGPTSMVAPFISALCSLSA